MDEEEGFDETDAQPTDERPTAGKPALLEKIAERATHASIAFQWQPFEYSTPDRGDVVEWSIDVEMPNGKSGNRTVSIDEEKAKYWLDSNFESWVFLANYVAVLDRSTNTIEAMLQTAGRSSGGASLLTLMSRIHRYALEEGSPQEYKDASPNTRTLKMNTQGTSLGSAEISPLASSLRVTVRSPALPVSLKLGTPGTIADEAAVPLLADLSASLFFEIDATYGIALALTEFPDPHRPIRITHRSNVPQRLPGLPKHRYSREATSLYFYGRSASNMPLLQFLAFYQVLEFFFPAYARTETIHRFQRRLKDPTFDPTNSSQVATLVSFLSADAKALQFEEEQLKATISGCTDDMELRTFIESSASRKESLSKKNLLKGVSHLNLQQNGNVPLLVAQVTKRIYEIRNRIVHAKEGGGPRGSDLLLPFGPEAKLLDNDVALVRFLAQRVLIQDAARGPWRA